MKPEEFQSQLEKIKEETPSEAVAALKRLEERLDELVAKDDSVEVVNILEEAIEELRPRDIDHTPVIEALGAVRAAVEAIPAPEAPEKLLPHLESLKTAIDSLNLSPQIKVDAPKVEVPAPDLTEVSKAITSLSRVIEENKVEIPDNSGLYDLMKKLEKAINKVNVSFHAPSTVTLPLDTDQGFMPVGSPSLITIIDTDDNPILYIGEAAPSTATSSNKWRITKIDTTGPISFLVAANGEFTQVFDDRTSLVYA